MASAVLNYQSRLSEEDSKSGPSDPFTECLTIEQPLQPNQSNLTSLAPILSRPTRKKLEGSLGQTFPLGAHRYPVDSKYWWKLGAVLSKCFMQDNLRDICERTRAPRDNWTEPIVLKIWAFPRPLFGFIFSLLFSLFLVILEDYNW